MFFIKFSLFLLLFLNLCIILYTISKLDSNRISIRCIKIQQYSILPYTQLRNAITGKANRIFLRLDENTRKRKIKDKENKLKLESDVKKVQRRQREVLRSQVYQPMDTCNLNLDMLPLLFKYLLIFILFVLIYYIYGFIDISTYVLYNYLLLILLYAVLHLIVSRLVLRYSRFWWWRPWPLILHRYVKGFRSLEYQKTLYILLLPIPFLYFALVFFLYFMQQRFIQFYWFYLYDKTLRFLIFSYFVEYSKFLIIKYYIVKKFIVKYLRKLRKPLRRVWWFIRLWRNKPKKKYKKY